MRTIVKRVILVDAPVPPFVGTRLTIRIAQAGESFGVNEGILAEGRDSVTLDWGDGNVETVAVISHTTHVYEMPGTYEVRISDDLAAMAVCSSSTTTDAILQVSSNAQRLTKLSGSCFARCESLTTVDLGDSAIARFPVQTFAYCRSLATYRLPQGLTAMAAYPFRECVSITKVDLPSGVVALPTGAFYGCTSLTGEILLPHVASIGGTAGSEPFNGCSGITAFHFAAANEQTIRASAGYQDDPSLGTGTAICVFDL